MRAPLYRASGVAVAFWILAIAWLCANLQPATMRSVLTWIGDSAKFSHQQRLTVDVAELLAGEKPMPVVAKTTPASKPAPAQPVLAEVAFKKIEMLLAGSVVVPPVLVRELDYLVTGYDARPRLRPAPPYEPPRDEAIS